MDKLIKIYVQRTVTEKIKKIKEFKLDEESIAPQSKCFTICEGKLTEELLNEISDVMFQNGIDFVVGDYRSKHESFNGFVTRQGNVWVSAHTNGYNYGESPTYYVWGYLGTGECES